MIAIFIILISCICIYVTIKFVNDDTEFCSQCGLPNSVNYLCKCSECYQYCCGPSENSEDALSACELEHLFECPEMADIEKKQSAQHIKEGKLRVINGGKNMAKEPL